MSQSDWRFIFLTDVIFPGTLEARYPHRKDVDRSHGSLKTVVLHGWFGIGTHPNMTVLGGGDSYSPGGLCMCVPAWVGVGCGFVVGWGCWWVYV